MKFNTSLRQLSVLALWTVASAAMAQTVYRNVDQNGKVSFSDKPPAANAVQALPRTGSSTAGNANLPYELRQVVQRYPVTLYTSEECGPCGAARSLLVTRGVPFDERTIKSNEDIEALQRLKLSTDIAVQGRKTSRIVRAFERFKI